MRGELTGAAPQAALAAPQPALAARDTRGAASMRARRVRTPAC